MKVNMLQQIRKLYFTHEDIDKTKLNSVRFKRLSAPFPEKMRYRMFSRCNFLNSPSQESLF